MRVGPITLAIPVFFSTVALELWLLRRQGKGDRYRLRDTLANLGCGTFQQAVAIFIGLGAVALHVGVYETFHVFELSASEPWVWLVAFVGVDFLYYLFHRASHEVGFLWAAHVVHHQSEDYNLAVALRQSAVQPAFSTWFYLPLTLLGFPPVVTLTTTALNALYQFWVHTELVGRMGWLENILNTPSHHRVHHGRNPQYIDRNHAGVFIVWDKWFGTFEPEVEPVVYGITRPLRSFSPLYANTRPWAELFADARRLPGWGDRVRLFLAQPGWWPAGAAAHPAGTFMTLTDAKFERPERAGRALQVAAMAASVVAVIGLLLFSDEIGLGATAVGVVGVSLILGALR